MWQFVSSILIAVFTYLLSHFGKPKSDVRYFYGPISDIPTPTPSESGQNSSSSNEQAHTNIPLGRAHGYRMHAVVILNAGNQTAHNIRIGHAWLPPAYSVNPPINIQHTDNPKEILIPTLCAGERVTISYLYITTVPVSDVTFYIKSDEGLAKMANLQHVKKVPKILLFFRASVFYIGIFAIIYMGLSVINFFIKLYELTIT